jgi:N-acetyl-anhydromuramyl-L-alanine amidase AmpD
MRFQRTDALIPFQPGQAISRGWTSATDFRPVGVTWHWTATRDLALCRSVLGGANAERRGEASAHYGIGRTFEEGIDRYVSIEDRSWHAGINQTLRWDGKPLQGDNRFKATRTTIGVETVCIGFARNSVNASEDWIVAADPTGKHVMRVEPWTEEQVEMMVTVGKEIIARWPQIGFRDHHGHHDICPGYKQDVAGFPFADVLRRIYDRPTIPDVWSTLQTPLQRQQALIDLGYGLGKAGADGDWGRFSDAALRRFQRDNGMVPDGMWTSFVSWKVHDVRISRGLSGFPTV